MGCNLAFKGLNGELNPVCYLLALLGAHPILHISRIRVKNAWCLLTVYWRYLLKKCGVKETEIIACRYFKRENEVIKIRTHVS